jgi:uncharacterized protein (TIGR00375 family)
MKFIADFHIHSHYSLATSKDLTPENLNSWAKIKGITVLGTGDCIHPKWLKELKDKLLPAENGLYRLKEEYNQDMPCFEREMYFILTTEISSIYKKNGKVRKVHNICVFPDFTAVEKLQKRLEKIGNIQSDGRPILGLDSKHLLEMVLESSEKSFLIPAHIWTPWFSVLGSRSGFDTIEECFEDLTQYIFAVETGLSSDPPMNRRCSFLDRFTLVSNSDAHSLQKLGREANIFDTEISYKSIYDALKYKNDFKNGFKGTIEFFPQEGKYFYDGHRKCDVCWNSIDTLKNNAKCPKCGKPVTLGVMYRVNELADRGIEDAIKMSKDFHSITSLIDLISEVVGKNTNSKCVQAEYFRLIKSLGADLDILLNISLSEIERIGGAKIAEGIKRLRAGEVIIQEGYDGEFGHITVFEKI